jgi:hypothetical protein
MRGAVVSERPSKASAPADPNPPAAPQPLLDLQRLGVGIRRRRHIWLATALLGAVVGALLAILIPTPPTAVTRLLIVHEEDQPSDGGALMRTDIALLETTRIAGLALNRLGVTDEKPEDFLTTYSAVGLTSNIMELTVEGDSDFDALARAKAVADTFVADHVGRIQAGADAEAKALTNQRNQAQQELAQVDAAIAALPPNPTGQRATESEALFARRAELNSKVSDFDQRAQEAGIGAPRVAAGTQVVDAPRLLKRSPAVTAATNAGLGLVLGLALGLAIAAVAGVVRDRPVLRREIAANLGASVIAQLPAPARGLGRLWRRKRAVMERKRVAATLARAVRAGQGGVSVLELGAPGVAATLAVDMAEILVDDSHVVIVNDLPRKAAELTVGPDSRVEVVDSGADVRPIWPNQRTLGVGSVAPGTAWTDLERLGTETLLVVRAGHANTLWLHTVARQLADCRIPVVGVVLVQPDRKDKTDGTLWDGLHTALRGRMARVENPAVPKPKTGVNGKNGSDTPSPRPHDRPTETFAAARAARVEHGGPYDGDLPTMRFAPVKPAASESGQTS